MIGKLAVVLTALVAFGVQVARAQTVPAFYVATNGSDFNPGTFDAPFLTLAAAQSAMQRSSTKTTYIRAGTYYPSSVGTWCTGDTQGDALYLASGTDDGETWSYYPPDGYGSAIIDGQADGNSGLGYGICLGAKNATVNGLTFQNFQISGLQINGANALIVNNTVNNITSTTEDSACIGTNNAQNGQIINNIVTNCTDMGIGSWPSSRNGAQNLFIGYNYIANACSATADCGGIYIDNEFGEPESGETVAYNYITNVSGGGGGEPIYLDDGTSNITVFGNVMTGSTIWQCYFIHGGSNNVAQGNICDLGTNKVMGPVSAQNEGLNMTGNTWTNNIILAAVSGTAVGGGYTCNTDPCQMIIGPNAYFNYAGQSVLSTGTNWYTAKHVPAHRQPHRQPNLHRARSILNINVEFNE